MGRLKVAAADSAQNFLDFLAGAAFMGSAWSFSDRHWVQSGAYMLAAAWCAWRSKLALRQLDIVRKVMEE